MVMATKDDSHCITIDEPGLAKSSSTDLPPLAQDQVKSLEEDPFQLCMTSREPGKWTIYKVPYRLRQVNEKAYEPSLVSIGPYHRGKEHLKPMEDIKKSIFNSMIEETEKEPLEFVRAMKGMEKKVRECYSDSQSLDGNSDAFVKMLVLDGCFIVQLFRYEHSTSNKSFLDLSGITTEIYFDLLLLENQLPFYVLSKLYGMIKTVNDEKAEFARMALARLARLVPGDKHPVFCNVWHVGCLRTFPKEINHILGLVHDSLFPQTPQGTRGKMPQFISCARELEEAGINFEKKETNEANLFGIEFTEGKLKIPTINIWKQTEIFFRNLVAYEQFSPTSKPSYVCDYVVFMDNLINSGKDVQLLRSSKVINNWLGDDEAVAQMFNKLHDFIYTSDSFYYAQMYHDLHSHCEKKCNEWKAKLKKDYFSYPWSILSVVAAVVLLLLTVQQSIFSALSYVHRQ